MMIMMITMTSNYDFLSAAKRSLTTLTLSSEDCCLSVLMPTNISLVNQGPREDHIESNSNCDGDNVPGAHPDISLDPDHSLAV